MAMPWAANQVTARGQEGDAVPGVFDAGELAVGEPGVGVDGGMDVGVAEPGWFLVTARPSLRD